MAFFFFFIINSLKINLYCNTLRAFLYHFPEFDIKLLDPYIFSLNYGFLNQFFMLYFLSTQVLKLTNFLFQYNLDLLNNYYKILLFSFFYSFLLKLFFYFVYFIIKKTNNIPFLINQNFGSF